MMNKKFLSLILASVLLLTSCGSQESKAPGNSESEESEVVIHDENASVKRDINFSEVYKAIEDKDYVAVFEPIAEAKSKVLLGMDIPKGYEAALASSYTNTNHFTITRIEDNKSYGSAIFYTAPSDLQKYYGTDDMESIHAQMISTYFPVMDIHDGLLKNATIDFGYTLVSDWTGEFEGNDFYLIEFVDEEAKTHSIRFVVGNSAIDDTFWSFEFRADLPSDDKELIEDYRSIMLSLAKH